MSGPFNALLRVLFPEKCAACHAVTGGGPLCKECAGKLRRLPEVRRHPRMMGEAEVMLAVYAYEGSGGALIRAFKFHGRKSCYEEMRPAFEEAVAGYCAKEAIDAVVSVPMYRASKAKRGFNQADEIARGLAKHLGVPFRPELLCKVKANRVQHSLPAGERAENVRGAYEARGSLAGMTVLLVDDILTTGATFSACTEALKAAGVAHVLCAAVLAA